MLDNEEMARKMKGICSMRVQNLLATLPILFIIPVVDLVKYLLSSGNNYEIFGWFSIDPLEKGFSNP